MSVGAVLFDSEEFWEDLLAFIEDGRVIPVVGKELFTIEEGGKQVSVFRVVAERLLSKYGLSAAALPGGEVLREFREMNDAVCVLARAGKRIKDLYRPVNDILSKVLAEHFVYYVNGQNRSACPQSLDFGPRRSKSASTLSTKN